MTDMPAPQPGDDEMEGVEPTEADDVTRPEQPPMEDDASGLSDEPSDDLGDFA